MKRYLSVLAVTLTLTLGGCAGTLPSILENVIGLPTGALAASITNPVKPVNIYQAKIVYADTLDVANAYREFCYSKPYKVLMADPIARPVCQSRRKIIRVVQAADDKAFAAIQLADTFVKNNPTLDASAAIRAAIAAVTSFQSVAADAAKSIQK